MESKEPRKRSRSRDQDRQRDQRDVREQRDHRDHRDNRDNRDRRDNRDHRDHRDQRDHRDNRNHRGGMQHQGGNRNNRDHRGNHRNDRNHGHNDRGRDQRDFNGPRHNGGKKGIKYEGDGHVDKNLEDSIKDDPREGTVIYRAKGGRNTDSFEPESTFVRPAMRIICGPKSKEYGKPLKHDDVVVTPEFFCQEDDLTVYYKLIEEMRQLQKENQKGSDWIPWHEGCHLISKNPKNCSVYESVLTKICDYFNIDPKSAGTRFNWYRDSSDWKPFHNDSAAYNPGRAKTQNVTVGVSFGAERELAFLHGQNNTRMYFPQTNGMLFHFGRDVNITWKHGVNALPKNEQNGQGRISIILWGLTKDVIEEKGSPPLLTNDTRNGFDNRSKDDKRRPAAEPTQMPQEISSKEGKVDKAFELLKDALDSDFKLTENQQKMIERLQKASVHETNQKNHQSNICVLSKTEKAPEEDKVLEQVENKENTQENKENSIIN